MRSLFTIASELSPYAVEIRYPDIPSPLPEEAREAVESADRIQKTILGMIG